jgi:HAD superfamily phosphoserine phosphatase-like hydrolase
MLKTIIISDFDGTITNSELASKFIVDTEGKVICEQLENAINNGRITLLEFMTYVCHCIGNVIKTHDKLYAYIDEVVRKYNIVIDHDIYQLYQICVDKNIEFKILSGGFKEFICHILNNYNSNNIKIDENKIVSHSIERMETNYRFKQNKEMPNKGEYIKKYYPKSEYNIILIGDGYSDIPAIPYCSLIFTKQNSILEKKCMTENIPHISFQTFSEVIQELQKQKIL